MRLDARASTSAPRARARDADSGAIAVIELAHARTANALDRDGFEALKRACETIESKRIARCVVVRGAGGNFSSGLDLSTANAILDARTADGCAGRANEALMRTIEAMQAGVSALERMSAPSIACVSGVCFGGGVDVITACDVRIASEDARFCVKEVDLGLAADLGTLQRLPTIVGHGRAMDLALTARTIDAREALAIGLVTEVVADVDARGMELARELAKKSPLALRGTKRVLLRARDDPNVAKGLDFVAAHNAAMLRSDDLSEALRARAERRPPVFSKL